MDGGSPLVRYVKGEQGVGWVTNWLARVANQLVNHHIRKLRQTPTLL